MKQEEQPVGPSGAAHWAGYAASPGAPGPSGNHARAECGAGSPSGGCPTEEASPHIEPPSPGGCQVDSHRTSTQTPAAHRTRCQTLIKTPIGQLSTCRPILTTDSQALQIQLTTAVVPE